MDRAANLVKNRTDDRVIVLKPMEGVNTLNSKGIIDNRLFNGINKLHARKADQGDFWHLQYELGDIPPALKGQFTTFSKCLAYTTDYFKKRNIEVVGVEDV